MAQLVTVDEAAEALGTTRRTLYQYKVRGILPDPVHTYGQTNVYDLKELEAWARKERRFKYRD